MLLSHVSLMFGAEQVVYSWLVGLISKQTNKGWSQNPGQGEKTKADKFSCWMLYNVSKHVHIQKRNVLTLILNVEWVPAYRTRSLFHRISQVALDPVNTVHVLQRSGSTAVLSDLLGPPIIIRSCNNPA